MYLFPKLSLRPSAVALSAALLTAPAWAAGKRVSPPDLGTMTSIEAKAFYLGLNALIWGYPEVLFEDLTRERALPDAEKTTGNPRSLVNQFGFMRELLGPEYKQIAIPNNDTLFAQAFCDVSREPLILSVPKVDPKRYPFNGAKRYRIHFAKDQLPRVNAFWSVSMYRLADGSFVVNPIHRYSIGDRTPGLQYNDDSSLTLYIQHDAPVDAKQNANWLPAQADGFYVTLRMYGPDDSLQKGMWKPPVVTVDK